MAEFMVLFGTDPQGDAERSLMDQIEAFLPVQFPDDVFRFGFSVSRAGVSVVPIAGHQEAAGSNLGEIVLAVEEIVRRKSPSTAS